MATRKTPAEGTDGTQDAPEGASLGEPRLTMPQAPRGLVGMSARDTVAKVTVVLQRALVQGRSFPDAWEAAEREVSLVATRNLHPAVASYKAEALDWLRGKKQQA